MTIWQKIYVGFSCAVVSVLYAAVAYKAICMIT